MLAPFLAGAAVAAGHAAVRALAARDALAGAVVAIAGGSRGLGLALADAFAAEGAKLALIARSELELAAAAERLSSRAVVRVVPCDLAQPVAAARAIADIEEALGPIDVLVNVAGTIEVAPGELASRSSFEHALDVNLRATIHTTLAALPGMRKRKAGRIVNVTSIGGAIAVPHLWAYSTSKFAAVGFSSGLAAEVAKDGIRVTTVLPGLMATGSAGHARFLGRTGAEAAWFGAAASLPGLAMRPERAARRIVSACKRGRRYVVLGAPAKAGRLFAALLPGTTIGLSSLAARLLPSPGLEEGPVRGFERWGHVPRWLRARADAKGAELHQQVDPTA